MLKDEELDNAPSSIAKVKVQKSDCSDIASGSVVVEEPLEIRLKQGDSEEQLGITMRTPGADLELAAGFLWGEGFLSNPNELVQVKVCADRSLTPRQRANVVIAEITADAPKPPRSMERRFTMTSACGVCGSTNISDLHARGIKKVTPTTHSLSELAGMTALLDGRQAIFSKTGGLHAAALVNPQGKAVYVREDVGRHNAMDKLVGHCLQDNLLPLAQHGILVSGRASFELMQKTLAARCPLLVAIGAPSSLAVELAQEYNLTLVGFLNRNRCNIYNGGFRLTE